MFHSLTGLFFISFDCFSRQTGVWGSWESSWQWGKGRLVWAMTSHTCRALSMGNQEPYLGTTGPGSSSCTHSWATLDVTEGGPPPGACSLSPLLLWKCVSGTHHSSHARTQFQNYLDVSTTPSTSPPWFWVFIWRTWVSLLFRLECAL